MVYFYVIRKFSSFHHGFVNKLFNAIRLDNINFENAYDCSAQRNNRAYKFMVFNSLKYSANIGKYIYYEIYLKLKIKSC
jgi:hypothetical protein